MLGLVNAAAYLRREVFLKLSKHSDKLSLNELVLSPSLLNLELHLIVTSFLVEVHCVDVLPKSFVHREGHLLGLFHSFLQVFEAIDLYGVKLIRILVVLNRLNPALNVRAALYLQNTRCSLS